MTAGHVHLVVGGEHGGGVLRLLEPAGDGLAQAGHLHPLLAGGVLGERPASAGSRRARAPARARARRRVGASARSTSSFMIRPSRPVPSTCGGVEAAVGHQLVGRGGVLDVARRGRGRRRVGGGGAGGGDRRRPSAGGAAAGDAAELAAGLHGGAVLGVDLGERAAGGRGHLDRDLVGLELAEHLVLGDRVADLLEPGRDRRLGDALAEGRDHDLDRLLVGRRRLRRRSAAALPAALGGRRLRRRRRRASRRRRRRGLAAGLLVDGGEERVDADGLALLGDDLGEDAGGGRRNLDRHLVGLELAEHLVDLDGVADLLEPGGDGGLGDALAERGHADVGHGVSGPS